MKKKFALILFIIVAGISLFLQQTSHRDNSSTLDMRNRAKSDPEKTEKELSVQGCVKESTRTQQKKNKNQLFWRSLDFITAQKEAGLPVGDSIKTGMVEKEKAISVAWENVKYRDTCDPNEPPEVLLVNDLYIITFWNFDSPFHSYPTRGIDTQTGVDAWTGELISIRLSGDSVCAIGYGRRTGGDGSEEKRHAYQERLGNSLLELHERINRGRLLESEQQMGMIDPQEAVKSAAKQVEDRLYDRNKEPWPLLVDDVYIVTFWKPEADIPTEGGRLYDCRIGVDAYTGEFIAMDVAPPFHRRRSVEE